MNKIHLHYYHQVHQTGPDDDGGWLDDTTLL